jgi:hypothetical protein
MPGDPGKAGTCMGVVVTLLMMLATLTRGDQDFQAVKSTDSGAKTPSLDG